MQKIRKFLIALVAIFIITSLFNSIALAAQVTKVQTKKGHIYINEGKDAGFIMGTEVCFYSSSGEKITCGKVRQTSASHAMVKINNRAAKKIKKGMEAAIKTEKE